MSPLTSLIGSLPELCRSLLQTGIGLALQSTLLLGVGLLAGRWLRRRGAAEAVFVYRATLVSLVLGALLAAPLGARVAPRWSRGLPSSRARASRLRLTDAALGWGTRAAVFPELLSERGLGAVAHPRGWSAPQTVNSPSHGHATTPILPAHRSSDPLPYPPTRTTRLGWMYVALAGIWAAGASVRLAALALGHHTIGRWRTAGSPANAGAATLLHRLCEAQRLRAPLLRVSPHVPGPVLTGVWHPAILLPATYERDFTPPSLEAVLAHELAHLQRGDCGWLLGVRLACALGWVQPLLWALAGRLEESSEEVCDEEVLRQKADPREYARCLVDLAAQLTRARERQTLGVRMARGRSAVERRVRRILAGEPAVARPLTRRVRFTILLGALALTTISLGVSAAGTAPASPPSPAAPHNTPAAHARTPRSVPHHAPAARRAPHTPPGYRKLQRAHMVNVRELMMLAGLVPAQGPGLVITLRDSPRRLAQAVNPGLGLVHDQDIIALLTELRAAGAEALAIAGADKQPHRLVSSTVPRSAGQGICVGSALLQGPYTIWAIGSPAAMEKQLRRPGGALDRLCLRPLDMVRIRPADQIVLPACCGQIRNQYARPVKHGKRRELT